MCRINHVVNNKILTLFYIGVQQFNLSYQFQDINEGKKAGFLGGGRRREKKKLKFLTSKTNRRQSDTVASHGIQCE